MKLLFIGIAPRPDFKKILLANHFEIYKSAAAADKGTDLVAVQIKNNKDLSKLPKLKADFPQAWLVAVLSKKLLDNAEFYNELLACKDKNAVWLEESWEPMFWISFQQMLEHRKQSTDLQLIQTSEKLVAQFEKDVGLAESIQRSLLPKFSPQIPGISIAAKYIPAAGLGGDYYDIFEFGDKKRFGVLLADSKTHGMAAALLSILLKMRLEEMKDRFPDSKSFVQFLNREFQQMRPKEIAPLSLLYGVFDRSTLSFHYTTAGSFQPLLWRSGSSVPLPAANNPPLGETIPFEYKEFKLDLKPGDLLILHTDGLHGPLGSKQTAAETLVRILKSKDFSPEPQQVQNEVMALIDKYVQDNKLKDDLTLLNFLIDERAMYLAQTT